MVVISRVKNLYLINLLYVHFTHISIFSNIRVASGVSLNCSELRSAGVQE